MLATKAKTFLIALLFCAVASAQTNYFPSGNPVRPNGMDLDRDGTIAELGVDDLACDGQGETTTSNISTEELDGDGADGVERQIYVDIDSGTDNTTCGTPGSPCRTVNYAGTTRNTATAASGDNLFICVQGTSSTRIDIDDTGFDGEAGTSTLTASGRSMSNQRWDTQLATDPTVIMGWDTNNNNEYPPYDTGDAGFHITDTNTHIVCTPNNCPSRIELAHFSGINAGTASSTVGGFFSMSSGAAVAGRGEHWYMHDFEAYQVNDQKCQHSGNVALSQFSNKLEWLVMRNFDMTVGGGYVWRGGGQGEYQLYERARILAYAIGGANTNLDINGADCTGAGGSEDTGLTFFRTWWPDVVETRHEYIDMYLGVDLSKGTNGYLNGLTGASEITIGIILGGHQYWNFAGNFVENVRGALPIVAYDDGISIDQISRDHYREHNTSIMTHAGAFATGVTHGIWGINQQGTSAPQTRDNHTGDLFVNDNCVDWSLKQDGVAEGFYMLGTSGFDFDAAVVEIDDNRVHMPSDGTRGVMWIAPNASCTTCVPLSFSFQGNVFRDTVGTTSHKMFNAANLNYSTVETTANNSYYGDQFENNGTVYSGLAAWQAAGFSETGSSAGTNPTFNACYTSADGVNYAGGGGGGGPDPTPSGVRLMLSN